MKRSAPISIGGSKTATKRAKRCSGCLSYVVGAKCSDCGTRRQTSRTSVSARCDKLWAAIIKAPGKCSRCGRRDTLEAAHIIGRAQRVVRWSISPRNGICFCHACHWLFDNYKLDRNAEIAYAIGALAHTDLIVKAQGVWDRQYPLAELTAAWKKAQQ